LDERALENDRVSARGSSIEESAETMENASVEDAKVLLLARYIFVYI
jgi:hypothetical protein